MDVVRMQMGDWSLRAATWLPRSSVTLQCAVKAGLTKAQALIYSRASKRYKTEVKSHCRGYCTASGFVMEFGKDKQCTVLENKASIFRIWNWDRTYVQALCGEITHNSRCFFFSAMIVGGGAGSEAPVGVIGLMELSCSIPQVLFQLKAGPAQSHALITKESISQWDSYRIFCYSFLTVCGSSNTSFSLT
jgi:hypothetical protein